VMDATFSRTVTYIALAFLLAAAVTGAAALVCATDAHAHGQSPSPSDIIVCDLQRGHAANSIEIGTTPIRTSAADTDMVAGDGYWLSSETRRGSEASPPIVHARAEVRLTFGDRLLL
jgi:hypothetical protein